MLQDRAGANAALLLVSILFLGISLFLNMPVIHNTSTEGIKGFLPGDQSTYYAMAQSIAFDGDLEYTRKDLLRYDEDFAAGPLGIFLKQVKAGDGEKLFYAKNFAYSLFAAPFVRVFGPNGPLVFHAALLFLLLLMGYSYFGLANSPGLSLLRVLTFLFASVAWIYYLWIAPDFFNLFLVFAALFLWQFKHRSRETGFPPAGPGTGRLRRFLLSDASDYLAAFVAGIAVYSKPPNIAVLGPILLWPLLNKKFAKAAGLAVAAALSVGILFGTTYLMTSDWNYQGGKRKSFYYHYPYERPDLTFDSAPGQEMTADGYLGKSLLPAKFVPVNAFYYFFGRYTGVAWYYFPAVLFLLLFVAGRKSLDQWLILIALAGEILVYIILMPTNYGGGGGSLANRYFLGIYPFFLFLPAVRIRRWEINLSWGVAALLLGQLFISPFQASEHPATHGKRFPFTLFPIERTLISDLPINTNPYATRLEWTHPPTNDRFLYFLNDNFHKKEATEDGWWTLGDRELDIMLRTFFPIKEIVFHLAGNSRQANEITMDVEGQVRKITLGPSEKGDLRFPVDDGFKIRVSHQYNIKLRAAKGATPYIEDRRSGDQRWLGVLFLPEVIGR